MLKSLVPSPALMTSQIPQELTAHREPELIPSRIPPVSPKIIKCKKLKGG